MGCDILLEDGSRILLEDGSSALVLDGCTPAGTGPGCDILLDEDPTSKILADDGVSAILQDGCTTTPTTETPQFGGIIIPRRRRRVAGLRIPLLDEEDEAVALALLEALRDRRRLSG